MYKQYRLKDNPTEERFLSTFSKFKDIDVSRIVTGTVDGSTPTKFLDEEEIAIVKGVIQWLGSPVGESFLAVCGFEKIKTEKGDKLIEQLNTMKKENDKNHPVLKSWWLNLKWW